MIIGLTGGIGSGKSAAGQCFSDLGIEIFDADDAARMVVEPGQAAWQDIKDHFGEAILLDDGQLNRAALRERVFANPKDRRVLEGFTHPRIRELLIEQLHTATSVYRILISPLLIESGQNALVEKVIVVDVPETTQVERTCKRDANNQAQVEKIMAAQMARTERLSHADWVLDNSQTPTFLKQQVAALHGEIIKHIL